MYHIDWIYEVEDPPFLDLLIIFNIDLYVLGYQSNIAINMLVIYDSIILLYPSRSLIAVTSAVDVWHVQTRIMELALS